jgi:hypothetical protein
MQVAEPPLLQQSGLLLNPVTNVSGQTRYVLRIKNEELVNHHLMNNGFTFLQKYQILIRDNGFTIVRAKSYFEVLEQKIIFDWTIFDSRLNFLIDDLGLNSRRLMNYPSLCTPSIKRSAIHFRLSTSK